MLPAKIWGMKACLKRYRIAARILETKHLRDLVSERAWYDQSGSDAHVEYTYDESQALEDQA